MKQTSARTTRVRPRRLDGVHRMDTSNWPSAIFTSACSQAEVTSGFVDYPRLLLLWRVCCRPSTTRGTRRAPGRSNEETPHCCGASVVGVTGFEPAASWSRTKRSTKLSYTPKGSSTRRSRPSHRHNVKEFPVATTTASTASTVMTHPVTTLTATTTARERGCRRHARARRRQATRRGWS